MSRFRRSDDGAYAILYAVLVVVLIAFASLVVDVASLRTDKRDARSAADFASLAGAADIGGGPYTPILACQTALANASQTLGVTFPNNDCTTQWTSDPTNTCPSGNAAAKFATATAGDYTVHIKWPVVDSYSGMTNPDGLDAGSGPRSVDTNFDGTDPCLRLSVDVSHSRTLGLAAALGYGHGTSDAASIARYTIGDGTDEYPYPLVILDQSACQALATSGTGANIVVTSGGASFPNLPGRIAVDSVGTGSGCGGNGTVLGTNGNGSYIQVVDGADASSVPDDRGSIEIFNNGSNMPPSNSYPSGDNSPCTPTTAAAPTNVPCVGRVIARPKRVTRLPFDLAFKPYVDRLTTALNGVTAGTSGWYTITTNNDCKNLDFNGAAATTLTNFYVDCPNSVSNWKLTKNWVFPPGSTVIVDGDLKFGGGCFLTNALASWNVANTCSGAFQPVSSSLSSSGTVLVRGNVDASGAGNLVLPDTFLTQVPKGSVTAPSFTGTSFSNIFWTAPYFADPDAALATCKATPTGLPPAQCFRNLAYWTESSTLDTIQGGASLTLEGTFFLGTAPLKVGGNGTIQVANSQFVARTITNSGGKTLTFTPNPARTHGVGRTGVSLIR